MPRLTPALVGFALLAAPAAADGPSPLDLVGGLRDNNMPDLAMQYIAEIEKANPSADVRAMLPLERAKVRLALALQETDEGARDGGLAEAKTEFQKFLKANGKHPRASEASLALARVLSVQAKGQLNKAYRVEDKAKKTAAAAATRPLFTQAAAAFQSAAAQIAAQRDDPGTDPARKRAIDRETMQAELDRGQTLYYSADTYFPTTPAEAKARYDVLERAKATFVELGKRDANNPLCWAAKAWAGACDIEKQEKPKADDLFKQIKADAARNAAAADGVRMVDFFEAQAKYLDARATNVLPAIRTARTALAEWLAKDKYKTRMTAERTSITYYYAYLSLVQGGSEVVRDPKDPKKRKILNVPTSARDLLLAANREYKKLLDFDNDYSDRAARERTAVIRYLVGNPDQPPEKFADFETCHMAALIKLADGTAEMDEADKDMTADLHAAKKKESLARAVALFERCRRLATSDIPMKDAADVNLQLAYTYLTADRPGPAAVLGEALARAGRPVGTAAKGGYLGVQAYLAAMTKNAGDGADEAKAADRERAIALAQYLEKAYPTDPLTDGVRFRLGLLYYEDQQYQSAFDTLGKISNTYASAAAARAVEGRAAYALSVSKTSTLTPQQKAAVFRKAVADAEAVNEPPPSAPAADAKAYLALRTLLAQLELANPPNGYAKAEQIAADAVKKAAAFVQLDAAGKMAVQFAADEVRLRALYAQAFPLYRDGKYKDLAARLGPSLADMAKGGPANKDMVGDAAIAAQSLDKFRREIVVLALQGKIREGAVDQAAELFDVLDKLGGSAEATSEVLGRLVALVKPQLDELTKANKAVEAKTLRASAAVILGKQADKPNLTPRIQTLLGRSLRELGVYDKAVEVLLKVPAANPDDLRKKTQDVDEKARALVAVYPLARLELARAHRLAKQFDQADAVLKEALGDAKKPGWARALDFRREAVFLLEDRAADTADAAAKVKKWSEARDAWLKIVREYQSAIARVPKEAKDDPAVMNQWERDREKIIPIYLGLFCDLQRCLARANTQLVANPAARADKLAKIADAILPVERANEKSLTADVRAAFAALLDEYPPIRDAYKKAGGKAFLEGS